MIVLVLYACGGTTGLEGDADSAIDVTSDPILDTVTDPASDPAGPGITFRIGFITDIPDYEHLFVQVSDVLGHQTWVSLVSGAGTLSMQRRCDICLCEECGECAVCGPALEMVERIPAGGSHEWTWDGTLYPISTCVPGPGGPEEMCQEPDVLPAGSYAARFCWATGPADAFPDGVIPSGDLVCADVEIDYPVEGGVVEYVVNYGG
jgi:hypothetical protein